MDRYRVLAASITAVKDCQDAWERLLERLKEKSRGYVTVNNAHTVVEATRHEDFRKIIEDSFLALPDGQPLVWAGRARGRDVGRVFGPTFFEYCLQMSEGKDIRHYFFGSTPAVLEKMEAVIRDRFPRLDIGGFFSPPFREFTEEEEKEMIRVMNRSGSDVFWISLGAPKQERWIARHIGSLDKGVMVGIGAGFDYLAGRTRHAPYWMKRFALEWLYRLFQEPKRLLKRYLIVNSLFIYYLLLDILRIKRLNTLSRS